MGIYGGEQRSTHAVEFILFVRNMGGGPSIAEFLGEAKVNHVNQVGGFSSAHDEIGWFYIAVHD